MYSALFGSWDYSEVFYEIVSSWILFPLQIVVRVIIFIVRVPVLSEQMLFAPPIVSQASIFLTKFSSTSIFLTEKAKERVTAKGKPSGMATTITVIARMKKFKSSGRSDFVSHSLDIPFSIANRTSRMIKIKIAEYKPNLPISYAIFSNFICRGVAVISSWFNTARILPEQEKSPTTVIIILPSPVKTFVPLIITGDAT